MTTERPAVDLAACPLLASLTSAAAAGDTAAVEAAADLLMDCHATQADVLYWYAAGPPHWLAPSFAEDGARLQILARWLRAVEPGFSVPVDPGQPPGRLQTLMFRWEAVKLVGPAVLGEWLMDARRRQVKREVLALFPEVTRTITHPVPEGVSPQDLMAELLERAISGVGAPAGKVEVKEDAAGVWVVQTVPAPGWIPLGPYRASADFDIIHATPL